MSRRGRVGGWVVVGVRPPLYAHGRRLLRRLCGRRSASNPPLVSSRCHAPLHPVDCPKIGQSELSASNNGMRPLATSFRVAEPGPVGEATIVPFTIDFTPNYLIPARVLYHRIVIYRLDGAIAALHAGSNQCR